MANEMNTLFAFYKGTPMQFATHDYLGFKKALTEQIETGLRQGDSIPTQIKRYKEQLDDLHEKVFSKVGHLGRFHQDDILTQLEQVIWFMNVASLIKLRALQEDEKNGFLVVKMK